MRGLLDNSGSKIVSICNIAKNEFKGSKYIMIRPHADSFHYQLKHLQGMKESIQLAKKNGAEGVVFGALKNGEIDFIINE